jgi:hypothetical protein
MANHGPGRFGGAKKSWPAVKVALPPDVPFDFAHGPGVERSGLQT